MSGGRHRPGRVVFTGGPAAGKTAILEILRRHLASEVAVVPEAATILFTGGLSRHRDAASRRLVQRAIFELQRCDEALYELKHPLIPHVCDRGTLDGAAYWPGGPEDFVTAMGTTVSRELARYDAVIFLQSTAFANGTWPSDGGIRTETPAQARTIDQRLRRIWQSHPHFHFVPCSETFYEKVAVCLITLNRVLGVGRDRLPMPAGQRIAPTGRLVLRHDAAAGDPPAADWCTAGADQGAMICRRRSWTRDLESGADNAAHTAETSPHSELQAESVPGAARIDQ